VGGVLPSEAAVLIAAAEPGDPLHGYTLEVNQEYGGYDYGWFNTTFSACKTYCDNLGSQCPMFLYGGPTAGGAWYTGYCFPKTHMPAKGGTILGLMAYTKGEADITTVIVRPSLGHACCILSHGV
jgi:hypothetical protein